MLPNGSSAVIQTADKNITIYIILVHELMHCEATYMQVTNPLLRNVSPLSIILLPLAKGIIQIQREIRTD